ncbi:hypothetical protein BGZ60DRAFT_138330 [Tricladium varicosporioides]|nr:hypothetical protein BGZ60DRAFT_138330 [Hymenoscyphus varicosporioides]
MLARHYKTHILVVFSIYATTIQGQCYFPGGSWASDQSPCDPYAFTTLCCPSGWTCFSNNLCIVTDLGAVKNAFPLGTAIRGTCTNPKWNNTACGDFCLDNPVSANNGSLQNCGSGKWCCDPAAAAGTCNCENGKGTFSVPIGEAKTIMGVTGMVSTGTDFLVPSSSTGEATTAKVSSSTSATSKLVTITLSTIPYSTSSSGTASTTQSGSAANSTATNVATPITQKTSFKVGIGTGIGVVALAILAIIGVFVWKRHQRRRALRNRMLDRSSSEILPPPVIGGESLLGRGPPTDPSMQMEMEPYHQSINSSLIQSGASQTGRGEEQSYNNRTSPPPSPVNRPRPLINPYRGQYNTRVPHDSVPYEGT